MSTQGEETTIEETTTENVAETTNNTSTETVETTSTETSKEQSSSETKQETTETSETKNDFDDDFESKVLGYFKEKGKEVDSLDDLFKEPEVVEKVVEKEVNPYDGVNFDEDDLQYFNFKKEYPHLGRKEYNFIQQDLDAISPIELATKRIEKETGQKFTKQDTIDYLEDKYNMDLSNLDDLTPREKIDLQTFIKPVKDELASQKEKYKQPESKKTSNSNNDVVTLENGMTVSKEAFDQQVAIRNNYLKKVEELSNSVDSLDFKFNVDDGGVETQVDFNYEFSKEDKQEMLSKLNDIDKTINTHFSNENGIDVESLGIAIQFGSKEKLGKLLNTAYQKGRADLAETQAKMENNVNFNSRGIPKKTNGKYDTKTVKVSEIFNR